MHIFVLVIVFVISYYVFYTNVFWNDLLNTKPWMISYDLYLFVWFILSFSKLCYVYIIKKDMSSPKTLFLCSMMLVLIARYIFFESKKELLSSGFLLCNVIVLIKLLLKTTFDDNINVIISTASVLLAIYEFSVVFGIAMLN